MNIVNEIIMKLKYLKPNEEINLIALKFLLNNDLQPYFNYNDAYEITINLNNNSLEIKNLSTLEEFGLLKKDNLLEFINKQNKDLLFWFKYNNEQISDTKNNMTRIISNDKFILINSQNDIISLTDLKIKIYGNNYWELKRQPQNNSKIVNLNYNDENKYAVIFKFLEDNLYKKENRVRKRILNLF